MHRCMISALILFLTQCGGEVGGGQAQGSEYTANKIDPISKNGEEGQIVRSGTSPSINCDQTSALQYDPTAFPVTDFSSTRSIDVWIQGMLKQQAFLRIGNVDRPVYYLLIEPPIVNPNVRVTSIYEIQEDIQRSISADIGLKQMERFADYPYLIGPFATTANEDGAKLYQASVCNLRLNEQYQTDTTMYWLIVIYSPVAYAFSRTYSYLTLNPYIIQALQMADTQSFRVERLELNLSLVLKPKQEAERLNGG